MDARRRICSYVEGKNPMHFQHFRTTISFHSPCITDMIMEESTYIQSRHTAYSSHVHNIRYQNYRNKITSDRKYPIITRHVPAFSLLGEKGWKILNNNFFKSIIKTITEISIKMQAHKDIENNSIIFRTMLNIAMFIFCLACLVMIFSLISTILKKMWFARPRNASTGEYRIRQPRTTAEMAVCNHTTKSE